MTHQTITDPLVQKSAVISQKSPLSRSRKKKQPHTWCDGAYNHAQGETSLWVAVITQAMMDALSRSDKTEAQYHKTEAINWLTGGGKDFKHVCQLAGLHPDDIRRKAKKALIAPNPWRASAGKGKRYLERKAYRQRIQREARKQVVAPPHASPSMAPQELPGGKIIVGPWLNSKAI